LREAKDVVPKPSLEVRLHLGQVKVRAVPSGDGAAGAVEEKEAKVEEGRAGRLAVDEEVGL
jgi:hypothetical protein